MATSQSSPVETNWLICFNIPDSVMQLRGHALDEAMPGATTQSYQELQKILGGIAVHSIQKSNGTVIVTGEEAECIALKTRVEAAHLGTMARIPSGSALRPA